MRTSLVRGLITTFHFSALILDLDYYSCIDPLLSWMEQPIDRRFTEGIGNGGNNWTAWI